MSLQDVVRIKDLLDGLRDYDFQDSGPGYWRRGWLPFLENGGGSYLCVDLVAADGGEAGQLLEFWKADEDRPVVYQSFDAWLESVAAAMQAGTFEWYT